MLYFGYWRCAAVGDVSGDDVHDFGHGGEMQNAHVDPSRWWNVWSLTPMVMLVNCICYLESLIVSSIPPQQFDARSLLLRLRTTC